MKLGPHRLDRERSYLIEELYAGEPMSEYVFVAASRDLIDEVIDHRTIMRAAQQNRHLFKREPEGGPDTPGYYTRWHVLDVPAWLDVLRGLDAERRLGEQEKGTWRGLRWNPERA